MMNKERNFLFLVSDSMSLYTMREIEELPNAKVVNKYRIFKNRFLDTFCRFYLSLNANKYISLPFKSFWYSMAFKMKSTSDKPLCIVFSPPWYDKQLIKFFRKRYPHCNLVIHFHDTVEKDLRYNQHLSIDTIRKDFDFAIVYNQDDEKKYGFLYHPVGYSHISVDSLKKYPHTDVVFIGAAKDRLEEIGNIYHRMTSAGLVCDFYVTEVPPNKRKDDGITYADSFLPFPECVAREVASDCLLEILQHSSKGRTYRMMEAIIYNKKLITNCPEVLDLKYYDKNSILYFTKLDDVSPEFINQNREPIDYHYSGDFSQMHFLEFIDTEIRNRVGK